MGQWNGFQSESFEFEGKTGYVIFPENPNPEKRWIFKTEYLGAFPAFDIEMLKLGYHLVHIANETRWCLKSDTERQANFAKYVIKKYGLNEKCCLLGLSCGGMQAVYLAANYPEIVSVIYIDAPVLNLLSCPGGIGHATNGMYFEFNRATGMTLSELINYREHPIDYAHKLIENKLPLFLVCGDSDNIVPYVENGQHLAKLYEVSDVPFSKIIKPGSGHHPHGLTDSTPIIEFVQKYY